MLAASLIEEAHEAGRRKARYLGRSAAATSDHDLSFRSSASPLMPYRVPSPHPPVATYYSSVVHYYVHCETTPGPLSLAFLTNYKGCDNPVPCSVALVR